MSNFTERHFDASAAMRTRELEDAAPGDSYFHLELSWEVETETWKLSQWHAAASFDGPLHWLPLCPADVKDVLVVFSVWVTQVFFGWTAEDVREPAPQWGEERAVGEGEIDYWKSEEQTKGN